MNGRGSLLTPSARPALAALQTHANTLLDVYLLLLSPPSFLPLIPAFLHYKLTGLFVYISPLFLADPPGPARSAVQVRLSARFYLFTFTRPNPATRPCPPGRGRRKTALTQANPTRSGYPKMPSDTTSQVYSESSIDRLFDHLSRALV
ncbi:hypothetical protein BKA93DRAFT_87802 [Sparassis latifolia]